MSAPKSDLLPTTMLPASVRFPLFRKMPPPRHSPAPVVAFSRARVQFLTVKGPSRNRAPPRLFASPFVLFPAKVPLLMSESSAAEMRTAPPWASFGLWLRFPAKVERPISAFFSFRKSAPPWPDRAMPPAVFPSMRVADIWKVAVVLSRINAPPSP